MNAPVRPVRVPPRMLEVLDVMSPCPETRRIVFNPSTLVALSKEHAGAHIKLFFPREDQVVPVLPTLGEQGPIWPPAHLKPIVRTYSVRKFCEASGELHVEFVLHHREGPASRWAQTATKGQRIGLAGPGPRLAIQPEIEKLYFFGDLSARPAIMAILESLPPTQRASAWIKVPSKASVLDVGLPENIEIHWIVRPGDAGSQLVEIARRLPRPNTKVFTWVAGEHSMVVGIRDDLQRRWDLEKSMMYAVPYWKTRESEEEYHEERHRVMGDKA